MMSKGRQMFTRYRHTMHKNILKAEDYYWYAWSREEREAMELIVNRCPSALQYCSSMTIKCESLSEKRDFLGKHPRVKLHFGNSYDSWPYPEVKITDTEITDPVLRSKLLAWVVRDHQLCHWQNRFDKYMHCAVWGGRIKMPDGEFEHFPGVNTPGQLYRLWPEFASLVERKYADRIASQKLRSAMPVGWSDEKMERFKSLPLMDEINQCLLTLGVMSEDMKNDNLYPDH